MKAFSIIEPPIKEFIEMALRHYGIDDPSTFLGHGHPQEDFLLQSNKYPIFVVADGVTLIQCIIDKGAYPNPSPAGDVARIFCEALVKSAEERYELFTEADITEIFKAGNEAVRKYNQEHGRTSASTDFWSNDLYAATVSFVVVKNNIAYWGSICDSYVAHVSNGELRFKSPDCNAKTEVEAPKFTGDTSDQKAKAIHNWSVRRNGVGDDGKLTGYGVVTGEDNAERYLNVGRLEVMAGDTLAILTDGFEEYVALPEFISLLQESPDDLGGRLREFTAEKAQENPDKFGHERSLIVVQVE